MCISSAGRKYLARCEILNSITPALGRFGKEGILLIGSTPYAKRGVLFDGYRKYFGNAEAICWVSPTLLMNPSYDAAIIATELEADPAKMRAEYYAEFRDDISAFIDRDIVESCIDAGVHERLRLAGQRYFCFIDSAGGSGQDSFAAAIAHQEDDGVVILDAVREYRPAFSPKHVVAEIAQWAKTYGVSAAQSDKWGGEFPIEEFAVHKIVVGASARPKSDIYRDMLPLLNSGKCRLLDNSRLVSQLCSLERRTARGGKDSIDHGPGAHDDLANSVAGAIVLASHHVRKLNFHPPTLGPPRSEWIAAQGFGMADGGLPVSMADGLGQLGEKPGGVVKNDDGVKLMSVEDAKAVLAGLEGKLSDVLDRRDKILVEIARTADKAAAIGGVGDQSAKISLGPLNKQAKAIDSEIALLRIDITGARRRLELAEGHARVRGLDRRSRLGEPGRLVQLEIRAPDGRVIRQFHKSVDAARAALQRRIRGDRGGYRRASSVRLGLARGRS